MVKNIRGVDTANYLNTPEQEAQLGKMREPSTGGYTVVEPDLAFGLKTRNEEEEDERASRRPKFDPKVRNYAKGGKVSSASSRADGCAQRGKTKGKMR